MIGDVNIYGVLFPPLLVWIGIALIISAGLRWLLNRCGAYRFIWHQPLFDLGLLVILTGLVSVIMTTCF